MKQNYLRGIARLVLEQRLVHEDQFTSATLIADENPIKKEINGGFRLDFERRLIVVSPDLSNAANARAPGVC